MDLEGLVRPVIESLGLQLVDVTFGRESGRRVLRVTIDREGGVDLDAIARTSERLSRRLDIEDFAEGSYALEVSSPGIERRLKRPEDFLRAVGSKVRIRTRDPVAGSRTHTGTLAAADETGIVVATDDEERRFGYPDLTAARTIFEWGQP
jgi:ribosome maturation factor RimP